MTNIYVTSYKPSKYTRLCLDSILATAIQPYTLTVISTPGSAAANKNLAINMCRSNSLILLDDDITFQTKGWNRMLIETLNAHPQCAIVGCKVIETNGHKTMSYQAQNNAIVDGVRVVGCAIAIRKTHLRYDERFIQSQCDDISLCLDARKTGNSVLCDTRIHVTHLNPNTSSIPQTHPNIVLAYQKHTKKRYLEWGRNPSKYKTLRKF